MLISRALAAARLLKAVKAPNNIRNMSGHAFVYRAGAPAHSKKTIYTAEVAGALMWWWILWHLWHEHEHITGEFEYPNPTKWTDEELGIPPPE